MTAAVFEWGCQRTALLDHIRCCGAALWNRHRAAVHRPANKRKLTHTRLSHRYLGAVQVEGGLLDGFNQCDMPLSPLPASYSGSTHPIPHYIVQPSPGSQILIPDYQTGAETTKWLITIQSVGFLGRTLKLGSFVSRSIAMVTKRSPLSMPLSCGVCSCIMALQ